MIEFKRRKYILIYLALTQIIGTDSKTRYYTYGRNVIEGDNSIQGADESNPSSSNNKLKRGGSLSNDETYYSICRETQKFKLEPNETSNGLKNKITYAISQQNRFLLTYNIKNVIQSQVNESDESSFEFELLSLSLTIFEKGVGENIVSLKWLENVIVLYTKLLEYVSPKRVRFTSPENYDRIKNILTNCSNSVEKTEFYTYCKQIRGLRNRVDDVICPKIENGYDIINSDPIFHIISKLVATVQNLCFEFFIEKSRRMYHLYVLSIFDTFHPARIRLKYQVEKIEWWQRLLGFEYNENIKNLDLVVEGLTLKNGHDLVVHLDEFPKNIRLKGGSIQNNSTNSTKAP